MCSSSLAHSVCIVGDKLMPQIPKGLTDTWICCVGDQFALFEAVVGLAILLRRFDFRMAPGAPAVGMTTVSFHHSPPHHDCVKRVMQRMLSSAVVSWRWTDACMAFSECCLPSCARNTQP